MYFIINKNEIRSKIFIYNKMINPPIGEPGLWFSNPANVYRITSTGVTGQRIWKRILIDRKQKLETYGTDGLLNLCAKSHKVNVYKHMCNLEIQDFFEKRRKNNIEKRYQVVSYFISYNIPLDVTRYFCNKFIPIN